MAIGGYHGGGVGQGQNLSKAIQLTGQLIVHTYNTVGWPDKGLLADKSSAALNKYDLKLNMLIKYTEIPT